MGNMISRQIRISGPTTYSFDGLNCPVLTYYPGTTPDVRKRYDADGHLIQTTNSQSVVEYRYDNNDKLITQVLTVRGVAYSLIFIYDERDALASIKPKTKK